MEIVIVMDGILKNPSNSNIEESSSVGVQDVSNRKSDTSCRAIAGDVVLFFAVIVMALAIGSSIAAMVMTSIPLVIVACVLLALFVFLLVVGVSLVVDGPQSSMKCMENNEKSSSVLSHAESSRRTEDESTSTESVLDDHQ